MGTLRLGLLPMPHRSLSGRALFRAKPVLRTSVLSAFLRTVNALGSCRIFALKPPASPPAPLILPFHLTHSSALKPVRVSAQFFSSLGSFGLCPALFDIPDKLLPHPLSPNFNVSSVKPFQTVSPSSLPMGFLFCFVFSYLNTTGI